MALWTRTANTVYTRSSENLINVTAFSSPSPQVITPRDLLYTFNATKGPTNSSADNSVIFLNTLFDQFIASGDDVSGAQNYLRQLLTFPIVWFQPNGFANPAADVPDPPLPPSLEVTAAFAASQRYNRSNGNKLHLSCRRDVLMVRHQFKTALGPPRRFAGNQRLSVD